MQRRIWSLFLIFILLFILITIRLFYWQVISAESLSAEAETQRSDDLIISARRGEIRDTSSGMLVSNQRAFLVYAEPRKMKNIEETASQISKIIDGNVASISSSLNNGSKYWAPLVHQVDEDKIQQLQKLNLPGIGFIEEDKRFYSEASMAAHLLGFVGKDAKGDDKGYFGLEGYYDMQLHGRNGYLRQEKDARGRPIIMGEQKKVEPENGRTLVLNIDKMVQYIIEKKLSEGIQKYQARGGGITVMDPTTGSILGMTSFPSYDPGNFRDYENVLYKNPVVADSYEPGSTFKVLVMAAGINENVVTPQTAFDENGPVQVGDYSIKTWNNKYGGKTTMTEVLERSSNVGMVFVSQKLGNQKLYNYIRNFGIGEMTGIDLEEETSPKLRPLSDWYPIDFATASFGQGIALTPIQMITAVASIANDGKLMEPHVVKKIVDEKGKTVEMKPKVVRQVVSPETAHIVSEMMVAAVDKGEARFAKPKGYRIAGKTGTAQVPIAGHYDSNKTIASFVGFAPAEKPKFTMLVTLREPTSSPWGSETAAPLFFSVARELFDYFGISPGS